MIRLSDGTASVIGKAGFFNKDLVAGAPDLVLLSIPGMGAARLQELRAWTGQIVPDQVKAVRAAKNLLSRYGYIITDINGESSC